MKYICSACEAELSGKRCKVKLSGRKDNFRYYGNITTIPEKSLKYMLCGKCKNKLETFLAMDLGLEA